MWMRALPAIVLATSAWAAPGPEVIYRCVDAEGVSYADRPCGPQAHPITTAPAPRMTLASADAPVAEAPAESGSTSSLVGLTSREVLGRFGRPWETRVHWRNRVLTETWTWHVGGQPYRLTFRDGKVIVP
jgi:hypothetical protein